jgi:hypothetical protein
MTIEEERRIDECHRYGPGTLGGCSERCQGARRRAYRIGGGETRCGITFIGKILGKGGFGTVSEVYDRDRGLTLVLKTVRIEPHEVAGGSSARRGAGAVLAYRFSDFPFPELSVLGRVRSCFLPYLTDFVTSSQCADLPIPEDEVGLLMPVASNSLKTLIDAGDASVAPEQLVSLLYSMARAVYVLHDCLFLHRDIKPDNFLCTDDQMSVFATDFGLACRIFYPDEVLSLRYVSGTARYGAPEAEEKAQYSRRSDYYSLGLAMEEFVTKPSDVQPLPPFENVAFPPDLPEYDRRLRYLMMGLERFGLAMNAEVERLATHILGFASLDPASRGELSDFLTLPVFAGLPSPPATVLLPKKANWAAAAKPWSEDAAWDVLAKVQPGEARWPAHLLVHDLAQRVYASAQGLAAYSKYMTETPFEATVFALAAVATDCPQLGLEQLAVYWFEALATGDLFPDLIQRFAAMARAEEYILEDLDLLQLVRTINDVYVIHQLVMTPSYLAVRDDLRGAIDYIEDSMGMARSPPVEVADLEILDLADMYQTEGRGNPRIEELAAAYARAQLR